MSQPQPGRRGPVVVDTGVFAAELLRRGAPLAASYRSLLEGRPFIVSVATVAEVRFGAELADWGAETATPRTATRPGLSRVGYWTSSSSTRLPVRYAILRSMYVRLDHRRMGTGSELIERFLLWAKNNECVEAHVDSYLANGTAQRFYEDHGFAGRSIARVLPL